MKAITERACSTLVICSAEHLKDLSKIIRELDLTAFAYCYFNPEALDVIGLGEITELSSISDTGTEKRDRK
ncbi:Hypothetical predicted protein [Podarcis lilfordi]|uniref:Uncharacterized protein n=1 Tax=Podarcis lilfordi TaxID=74358 RepID=A0AA35P9N0_9SAUR|nr:Hypothetical predicted protein [Podarcis lilfordi]